MLVPFRFLLIDLCRQVGSALRWAATRRVVCSGVLKDDMQTGPNEPCGAETPLTYTAHSVATLCRQNPLLDTDDDAAWLRDLRGCLTWPRQQWRGNRRVMDGGDGCGL